MAQNEMVDVTLLGTRTVEELEGSLALLNTPIDQEILAKVQQIIAPIHNTEWESGLNPD